MAGNKNQRFAVEKYEVEDDVLKWYKESIPAAEISRRLKERGIKISGVAINRFLKKYKEIDRSRHSIEEVKRFEAVVIDYKMELKNILDEVKEVKDKALADGNLGIYEKLVGRIYQGIQLIGEFMGDIKQKQQIDINVVLDQISEQSFLENKDNRGIFRDDTVIIDVDTEVQKEDDMEAEKIRN